MTYKEYVEQTQAEVNKLPLFWAFSKEQFEEALLKRGIEVADAKKHVYRSEALGGAFYLKKDAEIIRAYFSRDHIRDLHDMMESDAGFALDAFEYEMLNHEYPINLQGDWDVVSCFGAVEYSEYKTGPDYLAELGFSDKVIEQWAIARRKVYADHDW